MNATFEVWLLRHVPSAGSGTTGMVALELGRNAILCELNPDYLQLARQRCRVTPGLCL